MDMTRDEMRALLMWDDGYKLREIAAELGCDINKAFALKRDALKKLARARKAAQTPPGIDIGADKALQAV